VDGHEVRLEAPQREGRIAQPHRDRLVARAAAGHDTHALAREESDLDQAQRQFIVLRLGRRQHRSNGGFGAWAQTAQRNGCH
jgi:hypothetical protein